MENKEIIVEREKEIKRRKRTYKSSNPTKVIKDGWCHQCKIKQPEVLACVNFWKKKSKKRKGKKNGEESLMEKKESEYENENEFENEFENNKCNGKYCAKCIQKHYQQDFNELKEISQWKCFSCDLTCKCAVCRRKRGNNLLAKKKRMEEEKRKVPLERMKRIKLKDFDREGEEMIKFDDNYRFYPSFLRDETENEKINIAPYNFIHFSDSIPFIPPNSKFLSNPPNDSTIPNKFTIHHKEDHKEQYLDYIRKEERVFNGEENFLFSNESSMSDDSNDNFFQDSNLIKIDDIKMMNEMDNQHNLNLFSSSENCNEDFSILHQSNDFLVLDDNFHLLFNQC